MTNAVKRIGVLTSGATRLVERSHPRGRPLGPSTAASTASASGADSIGLINGDFVRLDENSVNHIINRGGTMLFIRQEAKSSAP